MYLHIVWEFIRHIGVLIEYSKNLSVSLEIVGKFFRILFVLHFVTEKNI